MSAELTEQEKDEERRKRDRWAKLAPALLPAARARLKRVGVALAIQAEPIITALNLLRLIYRREQGQGTNFTGVSTS